MRFDIVLKRIRPISKWRINDEDVTTYDKIQWMDENTSLPTYQEFETEWNVYLSEESLKHIRFTRNHLLQSTDIYVSVPDFPHATPEKKQEWLDYRQALRDFPSNAEDPVNPVWPVPPQ
tara:strand:+ start:601 stop:957 length:357 start_codon:yes stop_codon:yes gene_type:complete